MALPSCKDNAITDPSNSGGKPYEVVLSIEQSLWNGDVGETVRSTFMEAVPMFNQPEPMYDIVRVQPQDLKGILLQHRNLLVVRVTDEVKRATSVAQYDIYGKPQIILTVAAPDAVSLNEYLLDNRKELQIIFENTERERTISLAQKYGEKILVGDVYEMFGINISIPKGYKFRSKSGDDFMWISNEHPQASQGLVIYTYPYTDKDDFLAENLLKKRDEFVGRIPGPTDGSYMISSDIIDPEIRYLRVYDRSWAELSGFWDVQGDFMGGPYINFSTLDAANNRVIAVDCYVYSPKDPKRNYMRQLEHIVYSINMPAPVPATETETDSAE